MKKTALLLCASVPGLFSQLVFAEEYPNWELGADLMVDINSYRGYVYPADETTTDVRRAKLAVNGDVNAHIGFKVSASYETQEEFGLDDLYLSVKPGSNFLLVVGRFKEPGGMAKLQGLKTQGFRERSLATDVFGFGRKPGVKLAYDGSGWNAEAAVQQAKEKDAGVGDGQVLAARGSINPWRSEDKREFFHLGASYSARDSVKERFDINAPIAVASLGNLFHTPNYDADTVATSGVEMAFSARQLLFQTEFFQQNILEWDADKYQHSGYYASASWTLIGKARQYRKGEIKAYKKSKPVLEVAARISEVDSRNRGDGDYAQMATLSASYSFKRYYRVLLDYSYTTLERHKDYFVTDLDGDAFNLRLQLMY
ncbi:porin [Teredinibacter franksiae]|uniref:porin n=1 Tax=Teredinibacter franksiae TaxID=2761453 RepID=UPI001623F89D|nr:porin [Teredinibacter franksiae]